MVVRTVSQKFSHPCEGDSSKNNGADQQRLQISDPHFDKFPTPATFACWKIRFKTEVCTCSQFPTEAMLWTKEVEMVESVDGLKSSCSIRGTQTPDFELLDAKIASALNRIVQNTQFKRKVSLEEQKAQKEDCFLRGRQIAYRKTSQESINFERKSYLDCSSDTLCTRGRMWKGDIMVADIEELETMDASDIYSKRLNAKDVIFPKENEKFIFPVADGRIHVSGGEQELRTPTLMRDHPIRGEGQRDFLGESEGSPLPPPQDSYPDAGEAINDFWSMSGNFIYRHLVEPRVKLYPPREESFPIPLKYIDVSRTTHKFGC